MPIKLHLQQGSKNGEPDMHLLPCKILADQPADVSVKFKAHVREVNDGYYKVSFRGRPLEGKKIDLPKGYKGVTFYEKKKPDIGSVDRNFYCTGMFSQLTYWNYDKVPSRNDAIVGALEWIDIAEALHSTETE